MQGQKVNEKEWDWNFKEEVKTADPFEWGFEGSKPEVKTQVQDIFDFDSQSKPAEQKFDAFDFGDSSPQKPGSLFELDAFDFSPQKQKELKSAVFEEYFPKNNGFSGVNGDLNGLLNKEFVKDIPWNFSKFILNSQGQVIKYLTPRD